MLPPFVPVQSEWTWKNRTPSVSLCPRVLPHGPYHPFISARGCLATLLPHPCLPIPRMRLFDHDPLSLAGHDAPDFLQFDLSFPSSNSSSSLTAHCHSSCSTSTCMRDSTRRDQKFSHPSSLITAEEVRIDIHASHHLSHSDPFKNHPSSSSHSCDIFKPLPPVPKISSFHFSVIWNLYADPPSVLDVPPKILTRKSTLYDSSSIVATDGNHVSGGAGVVDVSDSSRAIHVSTDPYSPWPSPVRRHFMSRSDGSFSRISRYSRPESRSGARAPDPPSRPTSLGTIGCNVPGVRRVRRFTRSLRLFTQRMYALRTLLRKTRRRGPVIPPTPTTSLHRRRSTSVSGTSPFTSFMRSRSLRTSHSSAFTNTLQRWLEERNQVTYEKSSDRFSITISQYERRGSWLADDSRGIQHCDVHSSPPQSPSRSTTDRSITPVHLEPLMGKYVSVSLRAGEEASRRRKRNSGHTVTWTNSEFGSAGSLEYR